MLRHIVLFAFRETAAPADIAGVCTAFAHLPQTIANVVAFEWGVDVSPEGLQAGFTHAFLLTFVSEPDRDAYLVHPAHRAFVELASPHLAQTLVVDYWAASAAS